LNINRTQKLTLAPRKVDTFKVVQLVSAYHLFRSCAKSTRLSFFSGASSRSIRVFTTRHDLASVDTRWQHQCGCCYRRFCQVLLDQLFLTGGSRTSGVRNKILGNAKCDFRGYKFVCSWMYFFSK